MRCARANTAALIRMAIGVGTLQEGGEVIRINILVHHMVSQSKDMDNDVHKIR